MAWYDIFTSDRSHTTQPIDVVTAASADLQAGGKRGHTLGGFNPEYAAEQKAKYGSDLITPRPSATYGVPRVEDHLGNLWLGGKRVWDSLTNPLPPDGQMGPPKQRVAYSGPMETERPVEALPPQGSFEYNLTGGTGGAAAGGLVSGEPSTPVATPIVPPEKPFSYEVEVTTGGTTFEQAYTDPAGEGAEMVGKQYDATLTAGQGVVDTRAAQPKNVDDLEKSRGIEGYNQSRADLQDVTRQINDYNAVVKNVEVQVRNQYANSNLTEAEIQAEVTNRTRQLIPQGERLQAAYNTAKANYDIAVDATAQQFNARRADAAEAVNAATQAYGFKKEAAEMGLTLMMGLKNFEVSTEAQRDRKRDAARAYAVQAFSTPGMLQRMSPQAIATLEAEAQFYPGTIAGVRDTLADGKLIFGNVDDYGNFYYAKQRPDGSIAYGVKEGLAKIAPKTTAASVRVQESWANASPQYRAASSLHLNTYLKNLNGWDSAERVRRTLELVTILEIEARRPTSTAADKKDADAIRQALIGGPAVSELTAEELQNQIDVALDERT